MQKLSTAVAEAAKARWAGRPTEIELFGRATKVAEAIRAKRHQADVPISNITTGELAQVQRDLLNEGRSPATVNRIMSAFGTVLKHAADSGIRVAASLPPKLREGGRDPVVLTEKQLEDLFAYAFANVGWVVYDLMSLLLNTGLRVSEGLSIKAEDYDRSGRKLRVVRAKSGQVSYIPLNDAAVKALDAFFVTGHKAAVAGWDLDYTYFLREWKKCIEAAGLTYHSGLGPHVLRRTFATRLAAKGVPVPTIQKLLGHRSIVTTQRYIAVSAESEANAVNLVNFSPEDL